MTQPADQKGPPVFFIKIRKQVESMLFAERKHAHVTEFAERRKCWEIDTKHKLIYVDN